MIGPRHDPQATRLAARTDGDHLGDQPPQPERTVFGSFRRDFEANHAAAGTDGDGVKREFGNFARDVELPDHGRFLAGDGELDVTGDGVDGEILNRDLLGRGTERGGDLLIDPLQFNTAGAFVGFAVTGVDGDQAGGGGIANE